MESVFAKGTDISWNDIRKAVSSRMMDIEKQVSEHAAELNDSTLSLHHDVDAEIHVKLLQILQETGQGKLTIGNPKMKAAMTALADAMTAESASTGESDKSFLENYLRTKRGSSSYTLPALDNALNQLDEVLIAHDVDMVQRDRIGDAMRELFVKSRGKGEQSRERPR